MLNESSSFTVYVTSHPIFFGGHPNQLGCNEFFGELI